MPHRPAKPTAAVARRERDGLAVVNAAGRALASTALDEAEDGFAEALRILAEGFDAFVTGIIRFDDDGAHVSALWTKKGLLRNPQLRIGNEILPEGAPLRADGVPLVLDADDFGDEFAELLRLLGPGASMLATPIYDAGVVAGCVTLVAPDIRSLDDHDRSAVQLWGELVWRHMRHHDARVELHRRADVAEILADISGRLHEGGITEARSLIDGVLDAVGAYVDASAMRTFEVRGRTAQFLLERAGAGFEFDHRAVELSDELWSLLECGDVIAFDDMAPLEGAGDLVDGFYSGVLAPGLVDGELVGLFVLGRTDNRPLAAPMVDLVTGAVGLLGQFRVRVGAELDLVRRGVVEQARTEIAEAFLNSSAEEIDRTASEALARIGPLFGAARVRWVDMLDTLGSSSVPLEWVAGDRDDRPMEYTPDAVSAEWLAAREPFVIDPEMIRRFCGAESDSSTLIVPAVAGDEVRAALTLTGDAVGDVPTGELRTLTDLAGVILQARHRARQEIERGYRQVLDDLQLRLAGRFLDRGVTDSGETLDWVLAEIGRVVDTDLIAFAEYVGSSDGAMHWWKRDDRAETTARNLTENEGTFAEYFAQVLDSGEPDVTRSRLMPADDRAFAEAFVGSEFSLLIVPFRAPGIALLLGVCSMGDREWTDIEIALLQQVMGQLRQFIDVVAGRAQLQFDATHDALTGLANRRMMTDAFDDLLDAGRPGAVLMIDVDRFKVVNDSLGHTAGDAVLVEIADRIERSVRDADLVGRFGGDEFAILVRDGVSEFELASTAHRLIEVIREPMIVQGTTVIPTCSVGIAMSGGDDDVEAVIRHADAALYDAKAKGRDRYEFFDEARRQSLRDRLHLETALRSGVLAGEFVPWFQPEYDLIRNEIVGVEALVRWNHPTDGVLPAAQFIDIAEEIGLAPEMSRMVVQRSFAAMQDWIAEGFGTRMRVNVAAAQLQSSELAEQIGAALDEFSIPAELVCIEITERSLMLDPDTAIESLGAVRRLGVEVAVDDFGTGFSSLARLKHLPVDTLKIDRSFVSGIVHSATDREIVRTIVWLSRGLGLDVVAEGVEQQEQVEMLLELGCRRAQGWLWSPAVPADEVPRLARV
ncbi:MAG: GGDEF domain-containing protein [Actinomycetota bacterium]